MPDTIISWDDALATATAETDIAAGLRRRGVVHRVGDGVALVNGLDDVGSEELVRFDSGALGIAYDLREDETGIIVLTNAKDVGEGEGVVGLGRLPDIPVGPACLGRIVDPVGRPMDEGPPLSAVERLPLFRPAPEIHERKRVDATLQTGVMAIDGAIPIGRGQRELIIGDRNVGKTALALDIIAAQHKEDVACVYVVIGQPMARVLLLRDTLARAGCLENTAIIAADASAAPGMQYLAPYAGMSTAEWFRDQSGHALIIYDDLSKHADAYRELALLLERPPGREAYPGDIFYVHSELLERCAARRPDKGGGSVTAFPIVETTDGDIASYIPTNLISITDGQIYLDTARFDRNQRPAIDIGRSVSRIGSVAQPPAMRKAARNLRIQLARFESMESLTRVGLEMDVAMAANLRRGSCLREMLRQERLRPRGFAEQVIALTAIAGDWLGDLPITRVRPVIDALLSLGADENPEILNSLNEGQVPADGWDETLRGLMDRAKMVGGAS